MLRKTILATLAIYTATALAPLPGAHASTLVYPDGRPAPAFQRVVDTGTIPTPRGRFPIVVGANRCGGAFACTDGHTVYWETGNTVPTSGDAFILRHELGHLNNDLVMDDADRSTYLRLRGFPPPFFAPGGGSMIEHRESPDEDAADRYAECSENVGQRAICGFFRNVAARHPDRVDQPKIRFGRRGHHHRKRGQP